MTTKAERVAALDAFMAARKRVVRPDMQGRWLPGPIEDERQLKWPLEVGGEQVPDACLGVVGYPRERDLRFRLMVLFPGALCRLDYTEEVHPNPEAIMEDNLPDWVQGPHYHSWPINRRFFHTFDHPVRLRNAAPFDGGGRTFDAILRWFCEDNRIEALPPNHLIELPRLETLL